MQKKYSLKIASYLPVLVACSTLWLPVAEADIYKYTDANGVTHFADRPLSHQYKLVLESKKRTLARQESKARFKPGNRDHYIGMVDDVAKRYRIDAALIHAVITTESAYDHKAVSRAGAVGLMQLMPATAKRYGVNDRRNPLENLLGGVRYLRDLLIQFRSVPLALAAYNAGENAVAHYGNRIPPYPETQAYVRKVLTHYKRYRQTS
jgi:soluble lytic murein transglycosylase-like protein